MAVLTIVVSLVALIALIVVYNATSDKILSQKLYNAFLPLIVLMLLLFYLVFFYRKRRIQKLQSLLEQMSEEDFQFLLQVQSVSSIFYRYTPAFVLCRDKIYLFTVFKIKDIDPKKVEKVHWHYARGGGRMVDIKSPETISIEMSKSIYTLFINLIQKYNPRADLEI